MSEKNARYLVSVFCAMAFYWWQSSFWGMVFVLAALLVIVSAIEDVAEAIRERGL